MIQKLTCLRPWKNPVCQTVHSPDRKVAVTEKSEIAWGGGGVIYCATGNFTFNHVYDAKEEDKIYTKSRVETVPRNTL